MPKVQGNPIVAQVDKDWINTGEHDDIPSRANNVNFEHQEIEQMYGQGVVEYDDGVTKVRFRLLDDDEQPYYGGWLLDDSEGYVQMTLLDWGRADAGCTIIEVKKGGLWVREIG